VSVIAQKIFKYRSYTPIPFLIIILIFENATILSLIIGFITALFGETMRLWGVSWAGSETRTTGAVGGTFLIMSGPFARVRNPLYLGNILLYIGLGVMSFALFPYIQVFAFLFFLIQYHIIVKEEEKYLMEVFGNDYDEYAQNVPRFLPALRAYKNKSIKQPSFNLIAGLRSESRTLQAIASVAMLIFVKWFIRSNNII
jgi:protein-S-isoprenylcysteine O-methyltransferase Ste14